MMKIQQEALTALRMELEEKANMQQKEREAMDKMKQEVEGSKKAIEQERADFARKEAEMKQYFRDFRKQLDKKDRKCKNFENEILALKTQLNAEQNSKGLKNQLEEKDTQIETLRAQSQKLAEEVETWKANLEEKEAQISELERRLAVRSMDAEVTTTTVTAGEAEQGNIVPKTEVSEELEAGAAEPKARISNTKSLIDDDFKKAIGNLFGHITSGSHDTHLKKTEGTKKEKVPTAWPLV
eukprot:TRINITY_DN163_c0_g1_i2.p1 TRINITY_DN163_c0_g1~~TRINITY_DN163_c0_g1_i2.p1  ORF type:complete len:240 (-),score=75.51 TRINITY_DN163_c0_g1_i2:27-746(-)